MQSVGGFLVICRTSAPHFTCDALDIALHVSLHFAFYVPRTLLKERTTLFVFLVPTLKDNAFCHASRPSVEAIGWRGNGEANCLARNFIFLAPGPQADVRIQITP